MQEVLKILFRVGILLAVMLSIGVQNCLADFVKTISVFPLRNPSDWMGTYDPGKLVATLVHEKLKNQSGLDLAQVVTDSRKDLPDQFASQWAITGELRIFQTALPMKLESTQIEKKLAQTAKVEMTVNLVHGASQRILISRTFQGTSDQGKFPLGFSKNTLDIHHPKFAQTSAGQVLNKLTDQIAEFTLETIGTIALEAQVVAVDDDQEEVIINIGARNGVRVRDDFIVFDLTLNFKDPLHGANLGDWYRQAGVVRVRDVQEGFSVAVIMAGKQLQAGNLVRGRIHRLSKSEKTETDPFVPQTSISMMPNRAPKKKPATSQKFALRKEPVRRTPFFKVNFFDTLGWSLDY